jgi:hypothetical protein
MLIYVAVTALVLLAASILFEKPAPPKRQEPRFQAPYPSTSELMQSSYTRESSTREMAARR